MAKKKRQTKRYIETIGRVAVPQVPMIVTFEQKHVDYIAEHLGTALEKAYQIYALFGDLEEEEDPFGDDG